MTDQDRGSTAEKIADLFVGKPIIDADADLDHARMLLWTMAYTGRPLTPAAVTAVGEVSAAVAGMLAGLPLDTVTTVIEDARASIWQRAFPRADRPLIAKPSPGTCQATTDTGEPSRMEL